MDECELFFFIESHARLRMHVSEQPVCAAARYPSVVWRFSGRVSWIVQLLGWITKKNFAGLSYRSYRFAFVFILSRKHLGILEAHRLCWQQYSDLKVNWRYLVQKKTTFHKNRTNHSLRFCRDTSTAAGSTSAETTSVFLLRLQQGEPRGEQCARAHKCACKWIKCACIPWNMHAE